MLIVHLFRFARIANRRKGFRAHLRMQAQTCLSGLLPSLFLMILSFMFCMLRMALKMRFLDCDGSSLRNWLWMAGRRSRFFRGVKSFLSRVPMDVMDLVVRPTLPPSPPKFWTRVSRQTVWCRRTNKRKAILAHRQSCRLS